MSEKENGQDGFDNFGGELDTKIPGEREWTGRVIHQNPRRLGGQLLHGLFHRFLFLMTSCVLSDARPWENIKSGFVAHVALHGGNHGRFVRDFFDACFSQRKHHVRDRRPNEHDDAAKYSGEKDASAHGRITKEKVEIRKKKGPILVLALRRADRHSRAR